MQVHVNVSFDSNELSGGSLGPVNLAKVEETAFNPMWIYFIMQLIQMWMQMQNPNPNPTPPMPFPFPTPVPPTTTDAA
jgi:hypothetical protein